MHDVTRAYVKKLRRPVGPTLVNCMLYVVTGTVLRGALVALHGIQKSFATGDIVIVKKQVKSRDDNPAKQMISTRGPYRVLEPAEQQGSYYLQHIPFMQGLGKRGKHVKESAAWMEKLPSTLVIHKRANGIDSRLASLETPAVRNPLEKFLQIHQYRTYWSLDDEQYAFD